MSRAADGSATHVSGKPSAAVGYSSVVDAIGRSITSGEMATGAVLTLDRIQARFGISRTIAREVMRILESLGLVTSRRRVGLIVQPPASWNVLDGRVIRWRLDGPDRSAQLRSLTELRVALEPFAAAAAAEYATEEERAELVTLATRMRSYGEAGELEPFLDLDIRFHTLILRATRNELFSALTDVVAEVLAGRTHHGLMPPSPVPEALDAHEQIAQAITEHDSAAAEVAMHSAIAEVRETLRTEAR